MKTKLTVIQAKCLADQAEKLFDRAAAGRPWPLRFRKRMTTTPLARSRKTLCTTNLSPFMSGAITMDASSVSADALVELLKGPMAKPQQNIAAMLRKAGRKVTTIDATDERNIKVESHTPPSAEAICVAVLLSGHTQCQRALATAIANTPCELRHFACDGCLGDAAVIERELRLRERDEVIVRAKEAIMEYDGRTEFLRPLYSALEKLREALQAL